MIMNRRSIIRSLISFILPSGLLFGIGVIFSHYFNLIPHALMAFQILYPYLIFLGGMFLGIPFNRSRLVLALGVLFLADRIIMHSLPIEGEFSTVLIDYISLLVPINLLFIRCLRRIRLLSFKGLIQIAAIAVQIPVLMMIHQKWPHLMSSLRDLYSPGRSAIMTFYLPIPVIVLFCMACLIFTILFFMKKTRIDAAFAWASVSSLAALEYARTPSVSWIFSATAGTILAAAVLEAMYRLAFHDELTGLPGRRALNDMLNQIGTRYAIAMVDIDHFKKFNDTYGHDVGDQVLQMVASKLSHVGSGGKSYRYGGEEFSIIFSGKSASNVGPVLENLRKTIAGSSFAIRSWRRSFKKPSRPAAGKKAPRKVRVTVSIGLAENSVKHNTPEAVIKAADQALYRAKKSGRNQLCT
jgi:diguanylate cyclase (GGDEF)-like protein